MSILNTQGRNPALPYNNPRTSLAHLLVAKAAQQAFHVLAFVSKFLLLNEKFV